MDRYRDLGLLILRLGIGLNMLIFHGWDKITAGPALWQKVGGAMGNLGIHFLPIFWGFMAATAESVAATLVALGLFYRPAAAMAAFTMLVATIVHLKMPADAPNAGWSGAADALLYLTAFIGLGILGPGKFSLAPRWKRG
jgi:putative oxidoreductase